MAGQAVLARRLDHAFELRPRVMDRGFQRQSIGVSVGDVPEPKDGEEDAREEPRERR